MEENIDYKELWLRSTQVITLQNGYVEHLHKKVKEQEDDIIGYKKVLIENGWEVE